MTDNDTRCGYIALVGRPNVGKSTLLNHLLGQKLSITSRKPQTTRHNLLGIDTNENVQAIFVDTPGIHEATHRAINRYMVKSALSVLADVDLIVMLSEATRWTEEDELVVKHILRQKTKAVCAINKMDLLKDKSDLLPMIASIEKTQAFEEIIPISALKSQGLDVFRKLVAKYLPVSPYLFPEDTFTDKSEKFLCAEIVREKLMRRIGDEIPHRLSVVIERFSVDGSIINIDANIFVERAGQKAIVIGKGGSLLKAVGKEARKDIEQLVGGQVMLRLWVKVKSGWSNSEATLRQLGYD